MIIILCTDTRKFRNQFVLHFPERNGKMTFRADTCKNRPRSQRFQNVFLRVFLHLADE